MQLLVFILNEHLGIRTYASCGGHTTKSGRVNPAPKGEFYVSFATPLDASSNVEKSLTIIRAGVQKYDEKIVLEMDDFPSKDGHRFHSISGKGIDPRVFAGTLYAECKNIT